LRSLRCTSPSGLEINRTGFLGREKIETGIRLNTGSKCAP
jgi:hypothetical protein